MDVKAVPKHQQYTQGHIPEMPSSETFSQFPTRSRTIRLISEGRGRTPRIEAFRFAPEFAKAPSSFEFRFLVENRVYIYGFDVQGTRIVSEWLDLLRGDDELSIFDRGADGQTRVNEGVFRHFANDPKIAGTLKNLSAVALREDQLFLNRVSELPQGEQGGSLGGIIEWLTKSLAVLPADYRSPDILERLQSDRDFFEFSKAFLQQVGTGIDSLGIVETEKEIDHSTTRMFAKADVQSPGTLQMNDFSDLRLKNDDSSRILIRSLLALHRANGDSFPLPFSQESDGTGALLHLMPVLSPPKGGNAVFVIDELDRSLHPLICREFIRLFSETCPNERRQLIVTTHEAHLLDQELLRRDEYWFVEKDAMHQSHLTSLSDFNIRNDLQIQKGYLQGRFGAIPIIGSMDPMRRLLASGESQEK